MKKLLISLLLVSSTVAHAQEAMTKAQLREATDSIVGEANLLYKYEKAAWLSIDLAGTKPETKEIFADYLVYQKSDTLKTVILEKDDNCVGEFSFIYDFNAPCSEIYRLRSLNVREKELLSMKRKIGKGITDLKVEMGYPQGYGLNVALIPFHSGYKFYILTGTSQLNILPFGNDYLFYADQNGLITSWRKFHTRLLALETLGADGFLAKGTTHSHLQTEPFITATDICTFRLYGKICGQTDFMVYSPALKKYFRYILAENKVEITNKP